jgi:hypothetical protein
MSDAFYSKMRAVADRLLGPQSKFAQGALLLRRATPGTGPVYNPGPPTIADYALSGTVSGVDQFRADGTYVTVGDKMATVAVPEVEPTTADKLVIDGKEHQIARVERKPEAGPAVAFIIFAKA